MSENAKNPNNSNVSGSGKGKGKGKHKEIENGGSSTSKLLQDKSGNQKSDSSLHKRNQETLSFRETNMNNELLDQIWENIHDISEIKE